LTTRIGIRGRSVELYVRFVDAAGNPVNADDTPKVEISDSAGTVRQSLTHVGTSLADDPGIYCFTYDIPKTAPDGYWVDRWVAKIGNETIERSFDFLVISAGDIEESDEPEHYPGDPHIWEFTEDEVYGINRLLRMLKCRIKNDGVRKVPNAEGGYTEVECSVFTDDELICFLTSALSGFNEYPHFTQFTFSDPQIYTLFAEIVVQGAVLLAFAAQALIEKGREFSITDNGVTYQPPQISEILNSQYSAQLADYKEKLKIIKASLKPQPLGLGTFRVTSINPNYLRLRHLRERQII
jgi:hypothetical protein